jgi:hypothetical protein
MAAGMMVVDVIAGLGAGGAEAMFAKLVARKDNARFGSTFVSIPEVLRPQGRHCCYRLHGAQICGI